MALVVSSPSGDFGCLWTSVARNGSTPLMEPPDSLDSFGYFLFWALFVLLRIWLVTFFPVLTYFSDSHDSV